MGDVVHHNFGHTETCDEAIGTCADCGQAWWLILLSNIEPPVSEYEGQQQIVGYECVACGWRVDIKFPVAIVK